MIEIIIELQVRIFRKIPTSLNLSMDRKIDRLIY